MDFLKIAQTRYTTKKYDPTKLLSEKQISNLKNILRLSPSSINSQPWKFTFIANKAVKKKLAAVSFHNERNILEASHLVVFSVIDSVEYLDKHIEEHLSQRSIGLYKQLIKLKTPQEIAHWMESQVYISLGYFLSACAIMEIDSTAMGGIDRTAYQSILNTPNYKPLFAVAIGYRDPEDENQPAKKGKSRIDLDKVVESI